MKEAELKRMREQLSTVKANVEQQFMSKISNQCTHAFDYALKNDIAPTDLDEYLSKCANKFTVRDFTADPPALHPAYHDLTEINLLLDECFSWNAEHFVTYYKANLTTKFSDYSVAYENKQAALLKNQQEEAKRQQDLLNEKENKVVAAQIDANATNLQVDAPAVKALKKSYAVDLTENEASAAKIDAQFWANIHLTRSKVRAAWFKLTIAQKAKALSDVKDDDNAFQPQGIVFKEVEKL
jgi:SLT domain-containing protein